MTPFLPKLRSQGFALAGFVMLASAACSVSADSTSQDLDERHPGWQHDDAYVTDIGTLLFHDRDNDGYFAGISLTIDADTHEHDKRIYTVFELTGPDLVTEHLHTSADFTIYGNNLSDEYRIDIELLRNYPTAEYDLRISLHDAYNDQLLDLVDESSFSNLRQLPLESDDFDSFSASNDSSQNITHHESNPNILVDEYTGNAGLIFMLLLSSAVLLRSRFRSSLPTC
ncbi:MAG: choice-of-anchor H family protein [Granulosicoccus sp.]|nr:choice-of-anchor H family protein [Granulosicoccus sp.]